MNKDQWVVLQYILAHGGGFGYAALMLGKRECSITLFLPEPFCCFELSATTG